MEVDDLHRPPGRRGRVERRGDDPRRSAPEKLKTIVRHPVERVA